MVPGVRIDHACSKITIDYWQHNHYSLLFWWSINIEISLLFQQNIEYRFVLIFSLSISNPGSTFTAQQLLCALNQNFEHSDSSAAQKNNVSSRIKELESKLNDILKYVNTSKNFESSNCSSSSRGLGHLVTAEGIGIKPLPDKVEAIKKLPNPFRY